MLIANHYSSIIVQPGEQAFYFPSAFITPQFSTVLSCRFDTFGSVWRNQLNSGPLKLLIKRIAVIGFVANELFRLLFDKTILQGLLYERDFMRRSTRNAYGERKTITVCHCHDLRTLAPLGFPNTWAPFFAGAKVPSMKHSVRSSFPRSLRSVASASRIRSITPASFHSWKRRWQVWYGGYRSGISFHGAPVRRTQRIPSIISREDRRGRPRLSSRSGTTGISGSMTAHCSSLSSMAHLDIGL